MKTLDLPTIDGVADIDGSSEATSNDDSAATAAETEVA